MTKKQKLDKAIELLQQSSELYDQASRILKELNVVTYDSHRPIELHFTNHKPMIYIYSGVEEIGKIIGSNVYRLGHPYHDRIDERYHSINYDGIEIFEME
jgi:hypothetical protein